MEVFEPETVSILSDSELQVTPHGQVQWMPGAKSVFDLYVASEHQLARQRPDLTAETVRHVTGIRPLEDLPRPKVTTVEDNELPKKLIIHPETGIQLPALYWPDGELQPLLIAPGEGMNSALKLARERHMQGHPVLIVEVRDTGETKTRNWRFPGADSFIGHMLGRSWLTMRCEDLLTSGRWLAESSGWTQVMIHATGETAPAALHAGYLQPQLISSVQAENGLNSWQELMTSRKAYNHIHQAVYDALRYYDLPDLSPSVE